MNLFQKVAVFLVRLVGTVLAVIGLMGPLHVAIATLFVGNTPAYGSDRWWGSILYTFGGVLAVAFAKQIGQWLGRGLD